MDAPGGGTETLDDGTTIKHGIFGDAYDYKTLPGTMYYNDKKIIFESLDSFEFYYDYEYQQFVVLTLDMSDLTDKDLHWMDEENALKTPKLSMNEGANKLDSDDLYSAGTAKKDKKIYYFYYSDGYKESCAGTKISTIITIDQDNKNNKENKDSNLKPSNTYTYSKYVIPEDVESPETMDEWLYNSFNNNLQTIISNYRSALADM